MLDILTKLLIAYLTFAVIYYSVKEEENNK